MFKSIQLFKIADNWTQDIQAMQSALETSRFTDCGASQERSLGWTEPREEANAPLIESIGGHWIMKMMFETKILPGAVIKEETEKRAKSVETTTGRKPNKKERKEITEEARNDLMLKAFTKKSASLVWIDPATQFLVIESGSSAHCDDIISAMTSSFQGFAVSQIETNQSPIESMSTWLLDPSQLPEKFTADQDCTLKATDESKSSIRYAKHPLDIKEIEEHIKAGKIPIQLAMTWESRVSFILTETGSIKKIEFLDIVLDKNSVEKDSGFDSSAAIATGELSKLIPDLLEIRGGMK